MAPRSFLPNCRHLALLAGVFFLTACDSNRFKDIAGGYRLKRGEDGHQFALCLPREDGGAIIDEIGWREPIILFRTSGSEYWDLIDTAHAQHIRISDTERKSDAIFRTVPIESAEIAWNRLIPRKRLW